MTRSAKRPHVTIVQRRLYHYRTQFFDQLRARLARKGIDLTLVHGQPAPREQSRNDVGHLDWATAVTTRYLPAGSKDLSWVPLPGAAADCDLVVLMQENAVLSNYPVMAARLLGGRRKVAFWGHGKNFQADRPDGWREAIKAKLVTAVDWWFAYTQVTSDIVEAAGFPRDRITCLDNAIDNEKFERDLAAVTPAQLDAVRAELGIPADAKIGLFCGSIYPDKRLDLVVAAGDRLAATVPGFHLVVIGDGPSAPWLREQAASRPWLHCVGAKRGADKAVLFKLAHAVVNPGLVGLHVLDAFCAGLVMITTDDARHSPEIAYLRHGRNGVIASSKVEDYAAAVARVLQDMSYRGRLAAGALAASREYTLGNMVESFAAGIEDCLGMRVEPVVMDTPSHTAAQ